MLLSPRQVSVVVPPMPVPVPVLLLMLPVSHIDPENGCPTYERTRS
jgi:hypothetical protein